MDWILVLIYIMIALLCCCVIVAIYMILIATPSFDTQCEESNKQILIHNGFITYLIPNPKYEEECVVGVS